MGNAPLGYVKYIYYDRKHLRIWADRGARLCALSKVLRPLRLSSSPRSRTSESGTTSSYRTWRYGQSMWQTTICRSFSRETMGSPLCILYIYISIYIYASSLLKGTPWCQTFVIRLPDLIYIYIYTGYWWVRTCGPGWVRTCWGLVLSLVSTVWSAYGELARIATWVRSFGTRDLPKLPTHVRWTRSETWMQVWKNTLINDRDFMFCDSSKGWWDRKLQWF